MPSVRQRRDLACCIQDSDKCDDSIPTSLLQLSQLWAELQPLFVFSPLRANSGNSSPIQSLW